MAPGVVLALEEACRRVVSARISNRADRDDLTQEAVLRSLAAWTRITDAALLPYGVTVARNLCVERLTAAQREASKLHRFLERPTSEDPASVAQQQEERAAVVSAIATLRAGDRRLLLSHELDDQPLNDSLGSPRHTPGALAARLARGRAQARVEYVLALRGVSLPGASCRQVLVAISAADKRRQDALDAPAHLAGCPVCPALMEPLARRQAALAGLLPLPLVLGLARFTAVTRRARVRTATAAGLAIVVVGGITAAAVDRPHAAVLPVNEASARRSATTVLPPRPAAGTVAARPGIGIGPKPQTLTTSVPSGPSAVSRPTSAAASAPSTPLGVCYFAEGSASLTPADLSAISSAARRATAGHLLELTVTGMTDATGDPKDNAALAARRAATVAAALRNLTHVRVITATAAMRHPAGVARPANRSAVIS